MYVLAVIVLFVVGGALLFITPWVGAPLLLLAVVVGGLGIVLGAGRAAGSDEVEREPVESPHLPGPSDAPGGVG